MYRIFNTAIGSDIPLPELTTSSSFEPSARNIRFRISKLKSLLPTQPVWFECSHTDEKKTRVWMAIARHQGQYLIRFTDVADFLVDTRSLSIQCEPDPKTPDETIRHLLLDHIVPRILGHQGKLILHASSVALPNGCGLAFIGKSGWGKSTLASSLHQQGALLVGDDALLLNERNGQLRGIPAYSGFRLWQDSTDTLFPGRSELPFVAHYSKKKRLIMHDANETAPEIKISALFLLNDPAIPPASGSINIEPLVGANAMMSILKRTFLLDAEDMSVITRQFTSTRDIAACAPSIYSVSYERRYSQLDTLRAAIFSAVDVGA